MWSCDFFLSPKELQLINYYQKINFNFPLKCSNRVIVEGIREPRATIYLVAKFYLSGESILRK